jgi:hypothetical protein
MVLKARVRAGRLVVDEPTDLPEGTEVDLLPLDPGDWLDDADRAALHQALRESDADAPLAPLRLLRAHGRPGRGQALHDVGAVEGDAVEKVEGRDVHGVSRGTGPPRAHEMIQKRPHVRRA